MHKPRQPVQRMTMDSLLFRTRGLCYHYPDDTQALFDVSLDIAAGAKIALVGPNGAGKTTLIKQLCGLLAPTAGKVFYKGERLSEEYLERIRLEFGLLFQDPDDQLFGVTLIDDAAFGPRHQGLTRQLAEEAALHALQGVGLAEMAYKAPHNLSYGQKKRAALAGLLAMQPAVLLLDEPTAGLDPRQEEAFLSLLKDFTGTLLCISQDLIFLYELCDRAVVLDKGRIQHDYTVAELVSQHQSLRAHGLDFSFRLDVVASVPDPPSTQPMSAAQAPPLFPDASEDNPLVALRDFRYRYPDGSPALNGIHMSICRGERISLVGENGAGKTTLLSCLLGLRRGKGDFLFAGRPAIRRLLKTLWRQVGMIFQDCGDQLFCPSVREEISFGLHQIGYSKAEIRNRVDQALSMVRLEGFEERVPLHLSGGERKRLSLACVLAMQPELLLMDEPTAGLDPQGEELLLEILRNLEVTLLLVSHDMLFIKELTRRTLVMHQGKIIEDLPTRSFLNDERFSDLNGLSCSYRQRSTTAIRMLRHSQNHSHYPGI